MVKKKISGQTIVIIILAILLLLTIVFGGVFAFYSVRTNRVSGQILLADLDIKLTSISGESDQSHIVIYNEEYILPGQELTNSSLIVRNLSTVEIYLVVVYEIKAEKTIKVDDGEGGTIETVVAVEDEFINPVFGLGCEYLNSRYPSENITSLTDPDEVYNEDWYDYVFKGERENKWYRCMVSKNKLEKYKEGEQPKTVTVIGENKLSLHKKLGSEYEGSTLSFKFQAYAMGAGHNYGFSSSDTNMERCEKIVSNMYEAQGYKFLDFQK